MKKDCCDIKVSEVENGYAIEITGEGVKEKCKTFFKDCCTEQNLRKCFQACRGSK